MGNPRSCADNRWATSLFVQPASPSIFSLERRILVRAEFLNSVPDTLEFFHPKIRTSSTWLPQGANIYAVDMCENLHNRIVSCILDRKRPLEKASNLFLKLRSFLNIPQLKIVGSDKNSGLVAMHILHYDAMVKQHLNNDLIYQLIGMSNCSDWNFLLSGIQRDHKNLILRLRGLELPKYTKKFLLNSGITLPIFHCLPKLHKKNTPGRPIVGAPDWITTKWSVLLDVLLSNYFPPYALKNSLKLVEEIELHSIRSTQIFVTADVASMYTNMNLDRLYAVIQDISQKSVFVDILKFICTNNYFLYGDNIYKQLEGIAMGTPVAVICANLYMTQFDSFFAQRTFFYKRYIDDIFFILDTEFHDLLEIQTQMNNFIPGIKLEFTSSFFSVDFLDLTIFRNSSDRVCFKTFQKITSCFQYLPYSSCHHPSTISGYIKGELIRYTRINTVLYDRQTQFNKFYSLLLQRGFSHKYLKKIFFSIDLQNRQPIANRMSSSVIRIPFIIPFYNNALRKKLIEILRNVNESSSSRTLKFEIFPSYTKNKNLLELTSRSNISNLHVTYIASHE